MIVSVDVVRGRSTEVRITDAVKDVNDYWMRTWWVGIGRQGNQTIQKWSLETILVCSSQVAVSLENLHGADYNLGSLETMETVLNQF